MFQMHGRAVIMAAIPMATGERPAQSYKQAIPAIDLSLERATPNVPQDKHFYVLLKGEVKGRYRNFRQALALYRTLLQQSGYVPPPTATQAGEATPELVQRYMDELEDYWLDSHKYRRRGGKTMYRS